MSAVAVGLYTIGWLAAPGPMLALHVVGAATVAAVQYVSS
jgi:hypothetical protein